MHNNKRVLVAMSGGIDSSAVCLMLQEQGYEVVGMTMRVYDLPRQFAEGETDPDFIRSARELADRLGIEHHVADVRKREWADRLDCAFMATGHYVKTETAADGFTYLLMGDDVRKDQSYFLWRVPQQTLQRCIFPLGPFEKPQVRAYLDEKGFGVRAKQGESMEICFVEGDYRDFLLEQRPDLAEKVNGGRYVNTLGQDLGQHRGVPFYTVGQRKGLGIALGKPAYVVRLNAEKNTVVLGDEADLQTTAFFAENAELVNPEAFFADPNLTVRIRYHSNPVTCRAEILPDGRLLVRTTETLSAVTPGQSAVFYSGRRMVGGAFIASQKGIGQYL